MKFKHTVQCFLNHCRIHCQNRWVELIKCIVYSNVVVTVEVTVVRIFKETVSKNESAKQHLITKKKKKKF